MHQSHICMICIENGMTEYTCSYSCTRFVSLNFPWNSNGHYE